MTRPRQYAHWVGYPSFAGVPDVPDNVKFWAKVDKISSPCGCWLWLGKKVRGYGQFEAAESGVISQAHRWAYKNLVGALADDVELDHVVCRNPACVNPAHVEPVTDAQHNQRRTRKIVCSNGHQLLGANVRVNSYQRVCRACKREWARK